VRIETIDPRTDPSWDAFLLRTEGATAFHATAWTRVLTDTYHFEPAYLVAKTSGGVVEAGIPLMRTGSRRYIGLPFSDYCPPLLSDPSASAALVAASQNLSRRATVELRGSADFDVAAAGFKATCDFVRHVVPLDAPLLELKQRLHDSMQRSIRRAERDGLVARVSTQRDDLWRFFQLQTMTRKKHGLVPQPWRFFDSIYRHFIASGSGYVLLAERDGQALAGELLLRFKETLIDKFNASDPRFLSMRGNQLIVPLAFELGLSLGCRELDLGRSDVAADGLRRFKANCAGLEEPLNYFHYPEVDRGLAGASGSMKRRVLAYAVRLAPLWALRHAGSLLYRYAA
jgi:hypothetical protein